MSSARKSPSSPESPKSIKSKASISESSSRDKKVGSPGHLLGSSMASDTDLSCSINVDEEPRDKQDLISASICDLNDGGECCKINTNSRQVSGQGLKIIPPDEANESITTAETPDDQAATGFNCRHGAESRGECCGGNSPPIRAEPTLLYCNRERLKLKDFSSEIRASMDVEQFVHQAELMLDMTEVSVEDIVGAMIRRVITNDQASASRLNEARGVIFIPGSSMLMARTIQGATSMGADDRASETSSLIYDQSWLCALCHLALLSRRHMIVARFKQPINMGDKAHEVRLFMLIVTPSEEKGTKNALETGRTFATMLTDSNFRQLLLKARSELEFKTLMMVRAQQLSKTKGIKNRHKYMLDVAVHKSISSLNNNRPDETLSGSGSGLRSKLSPNGDSPAGQFTFSQIEIDENNNSGSIGKRKEAEANGFDLPAAGQQRDIMFARNPRSSKLFELISQTSQFSSPDKKLAGQLGGSLELSDNEHKLQVTSSSEQKSTPCNPFGLCRNLEFGTGLWNDFRRRARHYTSDFRDAFIGPPKTIQKTVATIWFLYFGILLPTIAFSALNTTQTHGHMGDLRKAIIGQAIGGLGFALLGGQPLVIIMTTAPLCLYTKVIHQMCIDYGFHFPAMYAAVGLWNGLFLTIYSLFGFSKLMKWCTRSTEEIFALFIVIAFVTDAGKDLMKNFNKYYYTQACQSAVNHTDLLASFATAASNGTSPSSTLIGELASNLPICRRETSLLFVLLMLGTLWLAITLYRFNKTPYLEASKREFLADYALPTAVIAMSFFGSYVFDDIYVEKFPPLVEIQFERAKVELLPWTGLVTSLGLGFTLSLLFFMDQNISAAMVNAPQNRLKKGCAYHFDLLVVGVLNGFLTLYGLPMMHGVLPHSPLHVRSLADIEERVEEGHLREVIVNVRETRVTAIVSHILVLGSLLLIPYPIAYIPTAVLNGLFLYMAITSLDGLQLFERILLLFTEQSKYPPNHYIRRCPQRKIHAFTMLQLIQLVVMCTFGFSPINIVEMFFPVIILLMIPFRHKIVPKYIDEKYLDALDGKH